MYTKTPDGLYHWNPDEGPSFTAERIALAYDSLGVLYSHGIPANVRERYPDRSPLWTLLEGLQVVEGPWLPEDLNQAVEVAGAVRTVVHRASQRDDSVPGTECRRVGIIGTANRIKSSRRPMGRGLYKSMVAHAESFLRTLPQCPVWLVSGGAAWSDHVAVSLWRKREALAETGLFIMGLSLHLPAPLVEDGYAPTPAGKRSNTLHLKFSRMINHKHGRRGSLLDLVYAASSGADVSTPRNPDSPAREAFFRRNDLVAATSDWLLAFTWGEDDEPVDGGTQYTWRRAAHLADRRVHVPLRSFVT